MILIPAIDLKDKKVVRLYKGKFDNTTFYALTPVEAAKQWITMGAMWLHVVDLDGAQTGTMTNLNVIQEIVTEAKKSNVSVQVGGGIRSRDIVKELLDLGISRVVIGTKAVEMQTLIEQSLMIGDILRTYGSDSVAVSIDCLNGYVTRRGWTEVSDVKGLVLAKGLEEVGVRTIIYTDISKDGTLHGPNFNDVLNILNQVNIDIIASGGISSLEDVRRLSNLMSKNKKYLWGAITGKAIYERKLDFKQAIDILK